MKESTFSEAAVSVDRIRKVAGAFLPQVVSLTRKLCEIPAPTDQEQERAAFVAAYWQERGWKPEIDELHNVVLRRTGVGGHRSLMWAAHLDTVFPAGTLLEVRQEAERMSGPGIGDNCVAVAALMVFPEMLDALDIQTPGDLLLAADVGEEGLGNLRGMRALIARHQGELGGVIALEGHMLGRVVHEAVGSKRLRVHLTGPGGHSWHAHGTPSAIHGLGRVIDQIALLQLTDSPRTTVNVGIIEGGTSVNTIAPSASAVVDMRSVAPDALAELDRQVQQIVTQVACELLKADIQVLGERPAGSISPDHPLAQTARRVLEQMGLEPETGEASTDANIPLSCGIPAVCVGVTRGSAAHTLQETIELPPILLGLEQMLHLAHRFPVEPEGSG